MAGTINMIKTLIIGLRRVPLDISLNGHPVKLPSEYLCFCPEIVSALNLSHRS